MIMCLYMCARARACVCVYACLCLCACSSHCTYGGQEITCSSQFLLPLGALGFNSCSGLVQSTSTGWQSQWPKYQCYQISVLSKWYFTDALNWLSEMEILTEHVTVLMLFWVLCIPTMFLINKLPLILRADLCVSWEKNLNGCLITHWCQNMLQINHHLLLFWEHCHESLSPH